MQVAAKEVAIEAAREAEERLEEQLRQVDCGEVSVSETCGGKSDESIPSNEESQGVSYFHQRPKRQLAVTFFLRTCISCSGCHNKGTWSFLWLAAAE